MQKEVSMFRLNLMRSLYLLICVGLGSEIWSLMFHHKPWGPDAWRCVQPACMRKLLTIHEHHGPDSAALVRRSSGRSARIGLTFKTVANALVQLE